MRDAPGTTPEPNKSHVLMVLADEGAGNREGHVADPQLPVQHRAVALPVAHPAQPVPGEVLGAEVPQQVAAPAGIGVDLRRDVL